MIITINTKEDSKEEIKKAINMLNRLVEHPEQAEFNPVLPGNFSDDNKKGTESSQGGIFGLFENPAPEPKPEENTEDSEEKIEVYDY